MEVDISSDREVDFMKIIESSIIGKKSPEACEDGMVVTDDFIAVIDGSTSKTPKHLNPDMKNGRYAMMLISEYIREELKADASVDDFCQGVTAYIYNKVYEKLGVEERLKEHPEERLTASAILYSRTRNEVWMVGDCQAIIDGKLYENGKPYEQEIARKRVELIEQGLSPAEARKQIEPLLIKAMLSGQNQTYTVIDGFPIYREGVKVVSVSDSCSVQDSVPASDSVPCSDSVSASGTISVSSSEIVLASDGYPFLEPTLAASEAALAEQIANDPQNIRSFIATKGIVEGNKSFDDRTYIRFVYWQ
ncbi:hypothetical protein RJT11_00565 [Segatella copri]|uniref:hypothetical protein n=1 Tax=Segatella copri TaxID=165179 RepID=UPI00294B592D|nr:hypothetical protein [Segatella copri]WOG04054.1 hypothetical protein RJT11_00565 [Segatella copri]